ncbi:TetR family transcriptional regulator C-terminal domain-containing protein [Urechidicola sp. KH5]
MAKKKNIQEKDIIQMYMDYVLEYNEAPKSVFSFCKQNNFEEALFYKHYASFEAVSNSIFTTFFTNTTTLLHKSEEFEHFDARNKLLSFYFTFFEILTANRSYVIYALSSNSNKLKTLKSLTGLRKHFHEFIEDLNIETLDLKQAQLEKIQNRALHEGAWAQLLVTIKFWIDDNSKGFEKTDVFIEKSVNASFDIIDIAPVKSVLDFGKFLFKEKMMHT